MEFNRNQYLFVGIFVLLIGLQVRNVSAYVLTPEATRILAESTGTSSTNSVLMSLSNDLGSEPKKVLHPPEWLGWCLMSVGGVLVLHSLAMQKPGG